MTDRQQQRWKHYEEEKALRKVKKQIKRNRKPDPVRRKDWVAGSYEDLDAWEDVDEPPAERVMPLGERERRQAVRLKSLADENEAEQEEGGTWDVELDVGARPPQRGRIMEVSSGMCRVEVDAHIWLCTVRGSLSAGDTGYTKLVAVGDEVIVSETAAGQGVVEEVLPRRSMLARPDVFHNHLQQVIVANADQLLIVSSWRQPSIWLELIDRYLIAAERNNLAPVVCVNKLDLATDRIGLESSLQPYRKLGYRVLLTSVVSGEGIAEGRDILRGRTTVLAGLSGVGKSSLLSAVQPGLELRTAEVNERQHQGRHTTTQARLLKLDVGGYVVDTPGIREFGLSGLRRAELAGFFPEIARAARGCRFANCSHAAELGCAVQAAVRQGRVAESRYHSYRKIYDSLAT